MNKDGLNSLLIAGITPYFLEKQAFWFEENLKEILKARKTQSFFEDNTLYVEKDQLINFSELLRKIDELGYEKVLRVSGPGEFSQQGGVVDIFPINMGQAVRLDFFGNKIEDIGLLETKLENEEKAKEILKKKLKSQKLFSDLSGLRPGDYLVHLDHGIARFKGIENFQIPIFNFQSVSNFQFSNKKAESRDYYVLEYAKGDKLFVPVGLERKLSRYVGFTEPKISRLGSPAWQLTKRKIKKEAENFAKELLEIYAKREVASRPPYPSNDEIDEKVAADFEYEETPDQKEAIKEIMKDLEKTEPMDRLICGDVGFGKTEVALRAMIRVAKSGYQAVLIAPTTILANQHFQNIKKRLKNFPFKIALLTRLQTKKEQSQIIKDLKKGKVDIIVGTHRLLSNDVASILFPTEIGLLVIDDEQKFGVKQKEKLKSLRAKIDILSLSATPIPRTLHLALSSLKNISLIQTPPKGRLPIKTFVLLFSKKIIKEVIRKEIKRQGQVYYLHNRVENILAVKKFLEDLLPEIKIGIAHGKIKEKELIKTMSDFQNKKIDVLLATTIIENGLDLPNVNTLIVSDATRLGLSQAYQIKGRTGRTNIQAFAYFLHRKRVTKKALLRLKFLKETEALGSGYRVALRDLEIRGAGNILGKEQSGSINRVGLNLYCQMLSEAVEKIKTV